MIEPLRWDESLAVGFLEIDQQHRELLEQANRLLARAEAGPPWLGLPGALDGLASGLEAHHRQEEWVMRWLGYPGLQDHLEQHQRLLSQLGRLRSRLDGAGGEVADLLAGSNDLMAAIIRHVAQSDRLVGRFANEHALSG